MCLFLLFAQTTAAKQWRAIHWIADYSKIYQMSTIDIARRVRVVWSKWNVSFLAFGGNLPNTSNWELHRYYFHVKFDWLNVMCVCVWCVFAVDCIIYPLIYMICEFWRWYTCLLGALFVCVCECGKYNSLCIATEAIHLWFYVFIWLKLW